MYTQIAEITPAGQVVPLEEAGPTVALLSQGDDHKVTFAQPGKRPKVLPSHEFFQTHREATRQEIDANTVTVADDPVDNSALRDAVARAEKAAETAEAAAKAAQTSAEAAAKVQVAAVDAAKTANDTKPETTKKS